MHGCHTRRQSLPSSHTALHWDRPDRLTWEGKNSSGEVMHTHTHIRMHAKNTHLHAHTRTHTHRHAHNHKQVIFMSNPLSVRDREYVIHTHRWHTHTHTANIPLQGHCVVKPRGVTYTHALCDRMWTWRMDGPIIFHSKPSYFIHSIQCVCGCGYAFLCVYAHLCVHARVTVRVLVLQTRQYERIHYRIFLLFLHTRGELSAITVIRLNLDWQGFQTHITNNEILITTSANNFP